MYKYGGGSCARLPEFAMTLPSDSPACTSVHGVLAVACVVRAPNAPQGPDLTDAWTQHVPICSRVCVK
jgi:hypothetical protein